MLTIKNWMNVVNYRISEGSTYGWKCYGENAHSLSSWDQKYNGVSSEIIFDTVTEEVYEVSVCDYSKNRAYRYINPKYADMQKSECDDRKVKYECAWDDVNYTDLESVDDWMQKAEAIMNYRDYDDRVQIEVDFDDDTLKQLFLEAHKRDITLNKLIEEILQEEIRKSND